MAWTTPRTWVNNENVNDTLMNLHVRDNLNAIASPQYADLRADTGTALTSATTWYAVAFDVELFNVGSMHSTSVNTSRVTAAVAGMYLCTGTVSVVSLPSSTAVGFLRAGIAKNGGNPDNYTSAYKVGATTLNTTWGASNTRLVSLAVGDYVELKAMNSDAGQTTSIASGTKATFQVRWVGP